MKQKQQSYLSRVVGQRGEEAAVEFLKRKGYQIVERNWTLNFGELDIIATKGSELIFVEVKSRLATSDAERYLFETITSKKQNKLRQLVQIYLDRNFSGRTKRPRFRIDVIGVILRGGDFNAIKIQQIVNAV